MVSVVVLAAQEAVGTDDRRVAVSIEMAASAEEAACGNAEETVSKKEAVSR